MFNNNLKPIAAFFIGSILFHSCTKFNRSDDFPVGDPPPVSGGYTNSNQIAAASLVGYWNFNGNIKDSISNVSGTNAGMTFTAGLKGQALTGNPDGNAKAYATSPTSTAIAALSQYTMSVWVNTPQNTGASGIFSIGDTKNFWGNINIYFENGGTSTLARFKTIYGDSGVTRDNSIQDVQNGFNNWTHYVITYDGNGVFNSYVNGSLARTNTVAGMKGSRFINVGPIVFGALHFMTLPSSTTGSSGESWAGYLPGKMDEVRIYNKALTVLEVSALSILERQGR